MIFVMPEGVMIRRRNGTLRYFHGMTAASARDVIRRRLRILPRSKRIAQLELFA